MIIAALLRHRRLVGVMKNRSFSELYIVWFLFEWILQNMVRHFVTQTGTSG